MTCISGIFLTDTHRVSLERVIEVTYGNLSESLDGISSSVLQTDSDSHYAA